MLTVEHLDPARLVPFERNARTHSAEQINQVVASINRFGWTNPILIDDAGGIIAGHARHAAAQILQMETVPCIRISHLTDQEKRALILADNKLALNAGWDEDMLAAELAAVGDLAAATGFSDLEIDRLMRGHSGLTDPDAVPDVPLEPRSRVGDVFHLGDHRLVCGDAAGRDLVQALMAGERADLVFTSPPYGQQRIYADGEIDDWLVLMQGVFGALPVKDGTQVLVNLGLVHRDNEWIPYWQGWVDWMRAEGWRSFGWYVWDQGPGLPGDWRGRLAPSHEFIFHFNRASGRANKTVKSTHAGEKLSPAGLRRTDGKIQRMTGAGDDIQSHRIPDSVFRVQRHKGGIGKAGKHPAVFPVELVEEVLGAFTKQGDVLFEPFCGSGTALIAATNRNRIVRAIEISPLYCDVAIRRWQEFTGCQATLDGKPFDEIGERDEVAA